MENWSNSWNQLSLEDKNDYKEKAKEINSEPSEPLNHSKQLLKKICSLIKELADTGVEACLMGVDLNQNMIEMGTPKMCSFIEDNPEIVQKVYLHITNGNQKTNGTDRFEDISELRKKAQDQMNMLFSKAVEKESRFPYKKVQDGKITISGVPAELLPIQRMSTYGKDKLKTIISLTELSVETKKTSSSENQTDNSTFQESDILTLTQEEYISLQNQDDIGVVELPNDFDLLTEFIIPTVTVTTTEHELSHTNLSTTTQLGQTQKKYTISYKQKNYTCTIDICKTIRHPHYYNSYTHCNN
ncbi:uncharacterized protein LOC134719723 [Mytilus trossulus]|uniref:uncharacterized protein LOC134719723 n=1 Tax=Mytilus trossulus TaxID=6551 RepID=UPI0030077C45